jgi:glycosyl transferase, family 25
MKKCKSYTITIVLLIIGYYSWSIYTFPFSRKETKAIEVDKIFILNLDRSTERFSRIKAELDGLNLPMDYERFSAIDGRKVKLVDTKTNQIISGGEVLDQKLLLKGEYKIICSDDFSGDFLPLKINMVNFPTRLIGEIGCACSHKKIWKEIIKRGYKNVIIFEDDMHFLANFKEGLYNILHNTPKDYELIYLFYINVGNAYKIKSKDKILQFILNTIESKLENKYLKKVRRNISLAAAYLLNENAAKKLFSNYNEYEPADEIIRHLIEAGNLTSYSTKPKIINACLSFDSTCQTDIGYFK